MSLQRIDKLFNFEKGSLQSSKCTPGQYDFVTAASEWKTHNDFTYDGEYLIFAAAAAGSLGRTHYVKGKFIASDLCFVLSPKDNVEFPIDIQFYHIIFRELKNDIVASTKAGTSKESISLGSFGKYELPYFPIEKQLETKSRFVDAELTRDKLTKAFTDQLAFVSQLRQAFLREAMQGKLVPQDETDEPAEIILETIRMEKATLIAEKKLKRDAPIPEIDADEIPYEVPQNWQWTRLGHCILSAKDGPHFSPVYASSGIPFISTRNISPDGIDFTSAKFITEKYHEVISRKCKPEKGDLLYTKGGTTGIARVNTYDLEFNVWVHVAVLKMTELIEPFYLQHCLNSSLCYRQSQEMTRGIGNQDLGLTRMVKILLPLPPRAEQKRIVEKLEKLMAFCDELEANIRQSKHHVETLLQVALKEALEPQ